MKASKRTVWIFMGSKTDEEIMSICEETLKSKAVPFKKFIHSAHREPGRIRELIKQAEKEKVVAIIAAAGLAAHLPGFIASQTEIPVLGVPLPSSTLGGLDSLLSIVQMPGGVPVATFGIGKPGAKNAALFAARLYRSGKF
jgi:5-(carboxyamino)imidazole ribonucleotide mutase